MKLKYIENDGVWEKKEEVQGINMMYMTPQGEGYNQAKAELSEVELVVDVEKIARKIFNFDFKGVWEGYVKAESLREEYLDKARTISSSISEWLRLSKGEA